MKSKTAILLFAFFASGFSPGQGSLTPEQEQLAKIALHRLQQEVAVATLLQDLGRAAPTVPLVLHNVRLVNAGAGSMARHQSVVTSGRRVVWVGDVAAEPKVPEGKIIDGGDRYLAPGLTDMHVHSSSASGWLLDLANGVTGVRDMAGFPWMLKARASINAGTMLAPSLVVAGPLINGDPLEGYAVVPADPQDARRIVREEAACGYNFVKVHNIVPLDVFDAVSQQATLEGMDLVGHVPHDISVRHAVAAGMRTMEHLKGFLNDATLKLGEADYGAVVGGPEVWNTPTLYSMREYARGPEADSYLSSPEVRFVPRRRRKAWSDLARNTDEAGARIGRDAIPLMKSIIGKLHETHARFLAGTDADGFPFQVMGFGLVEELRLLQEAGLSPSEAIRAATSEAASAMREPLEFGGIKKDMRADMVLLAANPLDDVSAYKENSGVVAHGVWLERAALDKALARLAAIADEDDAATVFSDVAVHEALSAAEALVAQGFVFDSRVFLSLERSLHAAAAADLAEQADRLASVPKTGPCAQPRP